MGDIERFFLINFLRISLVGTSIILLTDLVYGEDTLSILIDMVIVGACGLAFLVRRWSFTISVLLVTGITLAAMVYQCLVVPVNTTTSMSVLLLVGFIFSILLRGKLMWTMHAITCGSIFMIFALQTVNASFRISPDRGEVFTMAMTYFVLYFIITYSTAILKAQYDQVTQALRDANAELQVKADEIETQNEELLESHESVNQLNRNLESLVMERTAKVHAQNEVLLKYTYTNAHHLRGPVARLLGLISIHRLESNPDYDFFFSKVEDQAKEIDNVVKQINEELEESG